MYIDLEKEKETKRLYYENNKEKLREINRQYRLTHKEKLAERRKTTSKEYYQKNSVEIIRKNTEYYENNKDIITIKQRVQSKSYYQKNKDSIRLRHKAYTENNKEKKREYDKNRLDITAENERKRRTVDLLYKLKKNLRSLIHLGFKNGKFTKSCKTAEILGCNFEELKTHLESKFEPWMNWSNYGNWNGIPTEINTSWDIDHIIPLSLAKTEDEMIILNHYTNLQPLCSYTNRNIKRNNVK